MVEVVVSRLGLDSSTSTYVVILQEKHGARLLPIWIGQPEAEAIVMQMNRVKRERPYTHDLCKSLIVGLGASLRRAQITRVAQRTYFAELHLSGPSGHVTIDARPSDSIAVALRLDAPIFVADVLLGAPGDAVADDAGDTDDADDTAYTSPPASPPAAASRDDESLSAEELKDHLEKLGPEDFGKFSL